VAPRTTWERRLFIKASTDISCLRGASPALGLAWPLCRQLGQLAWQCFGCVEPFDGETRLRTLTLRRRDELGAPIRYHGAVARLAAASAVPESRKSVSVVAPVTAVTADPVLTAVTAGRPQRHGDPCHDGYYGHGGLGGTVSRLTTAM
jgi:hypothetical protein